MSIKEAAQVEPKGEAILTARHRIGENIEPAIDIFRSSEPEVFVAVDPDPFRKRRLGVIGLHHASKDQPASLEIFDAGGLDSDPAGLHEAVCGLGELENIDSAIVAETNLSNEVLRKAGATALPQGALEFQLAA